MSRLFVSLDRHTSLQASWCQPDRYRDLFDLSRSGPLAVAGAAVSYAAAGFGAQAETIQMTAFRRILAFDPQTPSITLEAGISLGSLFDFLTPRGLYLPVQPGHPQITIGGCIAAAVHGKNQYAEGLFTHWVEQIQLWHPDHGMMTLDRQSEAELFSLTCGGFGTTGIIVAATLRLAVLPGTELVVEKIPVDSFDETVARLDALKDQYDLLYSWNDMTRGGAAQGKGWIVAGRYSSEAQAKPSPVWAPLDPARKRWRPKIFSAASAAIINRTYAALETRKPRQTLPLFEVFYPVASKPFYFDWYGQGGFIEQQILVPTLAWTSWSEQTRRLLQTSDTAITLASIKAFRGIQSLLAYDGNGFSVSFDLPNSPQTLAFLDRLDSINSSHGAITNLIKDSRLSAETCRRQYPQAQEFTDRLQRYDPSRRFRNALTARLKL